MDGLTFEMWAYHVLMIGLISGCIVLVIYYNLKKFLKKILK